MRIDPPTLSSLKTHIPISISTIIPSEVLSEISARSLRTAERYPVIFNIPSSHLLHRIIRPSIDPPPSRTAETQSPPSLIPILASRHLPSTSPAQSLAKSLGLSSIFWVHPTVRRAFTGGTESSRPPPKKRSRPASFVASHPISRLYQNPDDTGAVRPSSSRNASSPSLLDGQMAGSVERCAISSILHLNYCLS